MQKKRLLALIMTGVMLTANVPGNAFLAMAEEGDIILEEVLDDGSISSDEGLQPAEDYSSDLPVDSLETDGSFDEVSLLEEPAANDDDLISGEDSADWEILMDEEDPEEDLTAEEALTEEEDLTAEDELTLEEEPAAEDELTLEEDLAGEEEPAVEDDLDEEELPEGFDVLLDAEELNTEELVDSDSDENVDLLAEDAEEDDALQDLSAEEGYVTVTLDAGEEGYFETPGNRTIEVQVSKEEGLYLDEHIPEAYPLESGYNAFYGYINPEESGSEWNPWEYFYPEEDVTLVVRWYHMHRIVWDAGDGYFDDDPEYHINNYDIVASEDNIVREDKIPTHPDTSKGLLGWSEDPDGTEPIVFYDDENQCFKYFANRDYTFYAIWADKATITLDANGGFWSFSDDDYITERSFILASGARLNLWDSGPQHEDPEKWFLGWGTEPDGEPVVGTGMESDQYWDVAGDQRLYAIWNDPVELTLDANGGYFVGSSYDSENDTWIEEQNTTRIEVKDKGKSTGWQNEPEIAPEGKRFKGWGYSADAEEPLEFDWDIEGYFVVTEPITLYAIWEEVATLTWDANGGYFTEERYDEENDVYYNEQISAKTDEKIVGESSGWQNEPEIAPEGKRFKGWGYSSDAEETLEYDEDINGYFEMTESVTLYAVWEDGIAVTWDANGGYFENDGEEPSLQRTTYLREGDYPWCDDPESNVEGKGFAGWALSADADDGIDIGEAFPEGIRESVTFYAVWGNLVEVIWDANGGYFGDQEDGITTNRTEAVEGNACWLWDEPEIDDDTKIFGGWALSPTAAEEADAITAAGTDGTMTVYAVWIDAVVLSFDPNGGSFPDVMYHSVDYGRYWLADGVLKTKFVPGSVWYIGADSALEDYVTRRLNAPEGKRFAGWALDPSGNEMTAYGDEDAQLRVSSDMTIYAVWADTVNVTFHANGGHYTVWDDDIEDEIEVSSKTGEYIKGSLLGWMEKEPDYPDGMTFVGWALDSDATSPEMILLEADTEVYAVWAVEHTAGIVGDNVYWTLADDGTMTIYGSGEMYHPGDWVWREVDTPITKVIITDGVTSIGEEAFTLIRTIQRIDIPKTVTELYAYSFAACTSLTEINVDSQNSEYASVDGVLLSKDQTELINCPAGKTGSYTIPDSVTHIGEMAFNDSRLDEIIIPGSVQSIGRRAFWGCVNLTSLTLPETVTNFEEGAVDTEDMPEQFKLFVVEGSAGHEYAIESGIDYELVSGTVHEHTLTKTEAVAATCTTAGNIEYYTCSGCGKLFTDAEGTNEIEEADTVVAATGHSLTKTAATAATCTAAGNIEYYTCGNCGKLYTDAEGTNEIEEADTVVGATGIHSLTKTDATAATCTTAGNIEYYTCSGCGKLFTDAEGTNEIEQADTVIAATGIHSLTRTAPTAATCTTAGNIEYYTCSSCGKLFSDAQGTNKIVEADTIVAATGHSLTKTAAKSATCTTAGNTEYYTCGNCGKLFSDAAGTNEIEQADTIIAATGVHNLTKKAAKSATCTTAGNIEYYTCSSCGKLFSDAEGTNEINQADTVVAATGIHSLTKTAAKSATCTAAGNIEYYTCSVCGKLFSDAGGTKEINQAATVVKALGHNWDDGKVTKAATCTTAGVKTFTCKRDTSHTKTETVAATGHTLTKTAAKAATCTAAGNIEYYTCSVCGKLYSDAGGTTEITQADTVVKALGHNWDSGKVTKAATCTAAGVKTFTCTHDASHTKTETVAATGHTMTKTAAKAATCTAAGNIEYYTCSSCGKLFSDAKGTTAITKDSTVIAAKGHTWGDWTVVKKATALAKGSQERTCTVCKTEKETQDIEKLPAKLNLSKTSAKVKKTKSVKVTAELAAGDSITAVSSNKKIASVSCKGKTITITANKTAGKANITVKTKTGLRKKITVTVPKAATTKITCKALTVKKGKTKALKPTVTPAYSDDKITYTSKNKKIATVDAKGKVKGIKKGSTYIVVKSGKKSVKVKVTVN